MMEKFWDLFERSIIVQSTLTLIVISAYVYMLVRGTPVPTELSGLATLVLGFWFGSKAGYNQGAKAMRKEILAPKDGE